MDALSLAVEAAVALRDWNARHPQIFGAVLAAWTDNGTVEVQARPTGAPGFHITGAAAGGALAPFSTRCSPASIPHFLCTTHPARSPASIPPAGPVSAVPRPQGGSGSTGHVCVACQLDDHFLCTTLASLGVYREGDCSCDHGQTCTGCGKAGPDQIGISIASPGALPEEYGFCGEACAALWAREHWTEATA